jgi:hypothetical protein
MKWWLGFVVSLSTLLAAFTMYAAWDHNPQGRFHERDPHGALLIHWGQWLGIGLSWFVMLAVPLTLAGVGFRWLRRPPKDARPPG